MPATCNVCQSTHAKKGSRFRMGGGLVLIAAIIFLLPGYGTTDSGRRLRPVRHGQGGAEIEIRLPPETHQHLLALKILAEV